MPWPRLRGKTGVEIEKQRHGNGPLGGDSRQAHRQRIGQYDGSESTTGEVGHGAADRARHASQKVPLSENTKTSPQGSRKIGPQTDQPQRARPTEGVVAPFQEYAREEQRGVQQISEDRRQQDQENFSTSCPCSKHLPCEPDRHVKRSEPGHAVCGPENTAKPPAIEEGKAQKERHGGIRRRSGR